MGNAGKSAEECMASFCEFELGYGHVVVQVVSRDNPAKFEEQYEVHVSDPFFFNVYIWSIFAQTARHISFYGPIPLSSPDILKKLTPCETLDIRTRITGTVSGTFWSTTSRDTALGRRKYCLASTKDNHFREKQFHIHRFQPTERYESFNPSV